MICDFNASFTSRNFERTNLASRARTFERGTEATSFPVMTDPGVVYTVHLTTKLPNEEITMRTRYIDFEVLGIEEVKKTSLRMLIEMRNAMDNCVINVERNT